MAYRTTFQEKDLSGFVQGSPGSTGAMVVHSRRGPALPKYCQGEDDVILHFGLPSAEYPSVFEAIAFSKAAPIWVSRAVGDEAVFGGIDVNQNSVTAFGTSAGRVDPSTVNYASINTYAEMSPTGNVDGLNAQFTGTATNLPVEAGSLIIWVEGERLTLDDATGAISGTDINVAGTNTIDYVTGAYDFTLAGTPGTYATVTSDVSVAAPIDLSGLNTAGYHGVTNTGSLAAFTGITVPGVTTGTYDLQYDIGGGNVNFQFALLAADDWDTIASKIQISLRAASAGTETVAITAGEMLFTDDATGSTSTITISDGTGAAAQGAFKAEVDGIGATYTLTFPAATIGTDVNYYIRVDVDGTSYDNISIGNGAATSQANLIAFINGATGATTAAVSTNFISFTGAVADGVTGAISVQDPTTGTSGLTIAFSSGGTTLSDAGSNPSGAIPKSGSTVKVGWIYNTDKSNIISHSFFTASACTDYLAGKVEYVSGQEFKLTLYEVVGTSNYIELDVYSYSLIREKDNFGRSLYYEDVFNDNPYVTMVVNSAYPGGAYSITASTVNFSGGYEGETPADATFQTNWTTYFTKKNKYPAKIIMDAVGNSSTQVNSIVTTNQVFSHAITPVPLGNTIANAVIHRTGTTINSDNISMYYEWAKIVDPYNDSAAWISQVGSVGKKYAKMKDVYNAGSPAGPDENGHGGILDDWQILELEQDISEAELQILDEAQINPIVLDEAQGLMVYGDKTMQSTLSDTSYIGTRRLYNYIIETITQQVLRKQEFKLNDAIHRLTAKMMTEDFLQPIVADGWISDIYVQCDKKNNNDAILNARKFILDVFVKVTPNSQFCQLKLTRLSQTQSIAQFI